MVLEQPITEEIKAAAAKAGPGRKKEQVERAAKVVTKE
jgi:hypothetical protein